MKKRLAALAAVVALTAGIVACGSSGGSTPAGPAAEVTPGLGSNVTVIMTEPGCHAFQTPSGKSLTQTVTGSAIVSNYDEAPLDVVTANGRPALNGPIPVGGKATLDAGTYTITMVDQEPEDNTLTLTVS